MNSASTLLYAILIASSLVCIRAPVDPPHHGFQVIVNGPAFGRQREALYVYAVHSDGLREADLEFTKSTGLQSSIVRTGIVRAEKGDFGFYMQVAVPPRHRGIRYGTYTASYEYKGDVSIRHGFTRPKTALLDTRGIYTVTIFPESVGSSGLSADSPDSVGVKWTPGCWAIKWCKGEEGVVHKGPRMKLTSIEQAGVYTLRRGARGARGWFVQIEVIAATCPEDQFFDAEGSGGCENRISLPCTNGGVLMDAQDGCTCPPFFGSADSFCNYPEPFVIADIGGGILHCGDLEGGNPTCRGFLFCYNDLYGCTCASGWHGNNCDRPCPKGKYGANCSQKCPPEESDCNRFVGSDESRLIN